MPAPPARRAPLPRGARVRARSEFDRVFAEGRRTAAPALALHWLADDGVPRLGLAVARKVDPHAVGRNRIKRQWREQFRRLRAQLPGGAYVLVARPPAARLDNAALREQLVALLQRAGALPPPDATGTMTTADRPQRTSPSSMPRPGAR